VLLSAGRRDRLDKTIVEIAADLAWSTVVTRQQCLRGVSTLTAFGLAVAVGDLSRFTGSSIGAFLGLVPTEHSSGGSRSQGSITKTGNILARRLLVGAAWQHKRPYRTPSAPMRSRW
jgi:transposase